MNVRMLAPIGAALLCILAVPALAENQSLFPLFKATAEDVLMVIAALPFIRGNPKNLRNGHLTDRRWSWNAD